MGCHEYQNQLMDAALGGLPPERHAALHAHLQECASCRAAFDRQRQLCAAMDQAIETGVAVNPSPEFLARVRGRIAEQPAPGRAWLSGWFPVTAGAVAVVTLLVVWFSSRPAGEPASESGPVVKLTPQPPLVEPPVVRPPQVPQKRPRPPAQVAASTARTDWPEVLVPSDQREGVRWLYQALQKRPESISGLLAEVAAQTEAAAAPLRIQELKIEPLEEIRPLQSAEKNGRT